VTTIIEKDLVTLEDGFIYFWASRNGALNSQQLRQIADELDKRNEKWQKQLNEYFEMQKHDTPNIYGEFSSIPHKSKTE
jgi:hypothetical protein